MLTIGETASRIGISADTIRYYEKEGLLQPDSRTDRGYRLYGERSFRRLRLIRQAQSCGFSLAEVAELMQLQGLEGSCCSDICQRAAAKQKELERKLRALQAMSASLGELIARCEEQGNKPLDFCPILAALEAGLAAPDVKERE